ncbi:transcriptional regulator [Neisseria dentiae]|uniref:Transcriptional regulator n=1 Tax=Neisseria dentiae TaxID=194197 RepID=A0A1X3DCH9_9NEIS|nr:helix-turn-helix domain-containing protein [Neisseria dentiae]OSI17442.1 transcriptional regulator [Neisseria dentiae]QMT45834.1 helix-turn-helix transcriptional regulator [Neisseria dentiae]STZ51818.1 HxlR family transcriptional regulator [Neisseria dentiae]
MRTECQTDFVQLNGKRYPCTVSLAMDLIGGKYKATILYHLQDGGKRFGELYACLNAATEAVLSKQLKELERDGLVSRTQYGTKPPVKTEYALTDFGRTAIPVLQAVTQWGNRVALEKGVWEECLHE